MCLRKLFPNWFKPDPVVPQEPPIMPPIDPPMTVKKTALLFGDNYPDTTYSLSGCINDIDDVAKTINLVSPGFTIKKFKNSEVTRSCFYNEIKNTLLASKAGDFILGWYSGHGTQTRSNHEPDGYDEKLFLHDGVFGDDEMMDLQQFTPEGVIFVLNLDSCFSGGMDRDIPFGNPHQVKNRFHAMPDTPPLTKRVISLAKLTSKWVINAGCQEGQTSADAWFDGRANGAYTFYYLKCYIPGTSLRQTMENLHNYLPNKNFDQNPEILGNESLFDYKY